MELNYFKKPFYCLNGLIQEGYEEIKVLMRWFQNNLDPLHQRRGLLMIIFLRLTSDGLLLHQSLNQYLETNLFILMRYEKDFIFEEESPKARARRAF